MGVRGAFGRLRTLIHGARQMAAGALERAEGQMMQECQAALAETVAESFLYQRTPDGKPWAARITVYGDFRDRNPLLFDLLSFMRYETRDGKVIAKNDKYYAFFHMTPYKRRVARVFLPSSTAPGKMRDRVKLALAQAIGRLLGKSSVGAAVPRFGLGLSSAITMPAVGGGAATAPTGDGVAVVDNQEDEERRR